MSVFISYRRSDTAAVAGRLFDHLTQRFGAGMIFYDVESIPLAADFRTKIDEQIVSSRVVLVLIGTGWMERGEGRRPRIFEESDVVRHEIALSFFHEDKIVILPVLIDGCRMPLTTELPLGIQDLACRNAAALSLGPNFEKDVQRISEIIRTAIPVGGTDGARWERYRDRLNYERIDPNMNALRTLLEKREKVPQFFVRSIESETDLRDLWTLDARAYGEINLDFEQYQSWWLACRSGLYGLYHCDRIAGGLGIWPVPESWIHAFARGEVSEAELHSSMIAEAAAAPCANWYLSGIVLDEGLRLTAAIVALLRETAIRWMLENQLSFPVSIWAMAISPEGERLLRHYDFTLQTPSRMMKAPHPLYRRSFVRRDLRTLTE